MQKKFISGFALIMVLSALSMGCGSDKQAKVTQTGRVPLDLRGMTDSQSGELPSSTRIYFESFSEEPVEWHEDTIGDDAYVKFSNGAMKLGVLGSAAGHREALATLQIKLLEGQKLPSKARIRIRLKFASLSSSGVNAHAAVQYGGAVNQRVWTTNDLIDAAFAGDSALDLVYDTQAAPATSTIYFSFFLETSVEDSDFNFSIDEIEITAL